nr:uncharacterized protein LOC123282855 isoform X2 [Equus asinus]
MASWAGGSSWAIGSWHPQEGKDKGGLLSAQTWKGSELSHPAGSPGQHCVMSQGRAEVTQMPVQVQSGGSEAFLPTPGAASRLLSSTQSSSFLLSAPQTVQQARFAPCPVCPSPCWSHYRKGGDPDAACKEVATCPSLLAFLPGKKIMQLGAGSRPSGSRALASPARSAATRRRAFPLPHLLLPSTKDPWDTHSYGRGTPPPPAKGKDPAPQMSRGNFCSPAQGPAPSFDDSGRFQSEGKQFLPRQSSSPRTGPSASPREFKLAPG